jgi:hypothetical protein
LCRERLDSQRLLAKAWLSGMCFQAPKGILFLLAVCGNPQRTAHYRLGGSVYRAG